MKAGDLRHRITLQRAETHTDERGRRITTWRDVATVMAAMADVSQKNLYVAQAYHAEDILTFTIRYRRSIRQEQSLPVRGAWIEIPLTGGIAAGTWSLPVRGAWIEIVSTCCL